MKNIISIFIIFVVVQNSYCQEAGMNRGRMLEKLEAQRVAFITTKLQLTADESARFWPVYNEYSKKRMELRKESRMHYGQQESEESVDDQLEKEEQALKLKKKYYEIFKTTLPESKLSKLEDAEKEFRMEVIKALRQRRAERNR